MLQRAGYSLEELYRLGRSSNLQQRCVALQTVARIIRRVRTGRALEGQGWVGSGSQTV